MFRKKKRLIKEYESKIKVLNDEIGWLQCRCNALISMNNEQKEDYELLIKSLEDVMSKQEEFYKPFDCAILIDKDRHITRFWNGCRFEDNWDKIKFEQRYGEVPNVEITMRIGREEI